MRCTSWPDLLTYAAVWFVWIYGAIEVPQLVLLHRLWSLSLAAVAWYAFVLLTTLFCFLRVTNSNPGYVQTDADVQTYVSRFLVRDRPGMEFCPKCNRERPVRSHHCGRCGRCVLEMDHHCPFVLNCIGELNRWRFILLLAYACLLCSTAQYHLWRDILGYYAPCVGGLACPQYLQLRLAGAVLICLSTLVGVGMLLTVQIIGIRQGRTTLELMKMLRKHPDGEPPTRQLRLVEALSRVCGYESPWLWPVPCRRRKDRLIDEEIVRLSQLNV